MIILGIFLIILQILDILTTNIGIKLGCEEGNPLLKKSFKMGIPIKLVIIKIALSAFLTFLLFLGSIMLNWILVGLDLFTFIIVVSNIITIQIQKKWNKIFNIEGESMKNVLQVKDVREWVTAIQHSKKKY
ncbi:MAG: hypothetical protein KAW51_03600 [Candidatus Lokiarchaeota archaeon]|nr:hypothetical protein [Candidatus Lokiarchaeota archaeon]